MPREELPRETNEELGQAEFIETLTRVDGEYVGVQIRSRPVQPAANGENDDALARFYGWLTVKSSEQLRLRIGPAEVPNPLPERLVIGAVRVDVSELEAATLRTFDGNDYFVITARFPAFELRIADEYLS